MAQDFEKCLLKSARTFREVQANTGGYSGDILNDASQIVCDQYRGTGTVSIGKYGTPDEDSENVGKKSSKEYSSKRTELKKKN